MKRIRRIIRALDPKADATMGQRERLEAFRIRRAAVLVLVLFLLIASMTSCSVHALLVRMTPNTQTTAQATHSTSAKKPAKKTAKTNQHKTAKKTKPETKQSQEEQAVAKAVSAQSAALGDDEKTAILNKAQETAQNSGKPVTQYHYCIATKGNVGSADEFGNAAFRILNDYSKKMNERFNIKAAFMEGKILSDGEIKELASLPSKEALVSVVLGTMLAPITSLAVVLDQIAKKNGEAAPAAEAPAAE